MEFSAGLRLFVHLEQLCEKQMIEQGGDEAFAAGASLPVPDALARLLAARSRQLALTLASPEAFWLLRHAAALPEAASHVVGSWISEAVNDALGVADGGTSGARTAAEPPHPASNCNQSSKAGLTSDGVACTDTEAGHEQHRSRAATEQPPVVGRLIALNCGQLAERSESVAQTIRQYRSAVAVLSDAITSGHPFIQHLQTTGREPHATVAGDQVNGTSGLQDLDSNTASKLQTAVTLDILQRVFASAPEASSVLLDSGVSDAIRRLLLVHGGSFGDDAASALIMLHATQTLRQLLVAVCWDLGAEHMSCNDGPSCSRRHAASLLQNASNHVIKLLKALHDRKGAPTEAHAGCDQGPRSLHAALMMEVLNLSNAVLAFGPVAGQICRSLTDISMLEHARSDHMHTEAAGLNSAALASAECLHSNKLVHQAVRGVLNPQAAQDPVTVTDEAGLLASLLEPDTNASFDKVHLPKAKIPAAALFPLSDEFAMNSGNVRREKRSQAVPTNGMHHQSAAGTSKPSTQPLGVAGTFIGVQASDQHSIQQSQQILVSELSVGHPNQLKLAALQTLQLLLSHELHAAAHHGCATSRSSTRHVPQQTMAPDGACKAAGASGCGNPQAGDSAAQPTPGYGAQSATGLRDPADAGPSVISAAQLMQWSFGSTGVLKALCLQCLWQTMALAACSSSSSTHEATPLLGAPFPSLVPALLCDLQNAAASEYLLVRSAALTGLAVLLTLAGHQSEAGATCVGTSAADVSAAPPPPGLPAAAALRSALVNSDWNRSLLADCLHRLGVLPSSAALAGPSAGQCHSVPGLHSQTPFLRHVVKSIFVGGCMF